MTVLISAGGATVAVWMSVILAVGVAYALRRSRPRARGARGAGRGRSSNDSYITDQAVLFAGSDSYSHHDSGSSCDSGGGDSGGGDSGGGDSGGGCD